MRLILVFLTFSFFISAQKKKEKTNPCGMQLQEFSSCNESVKAYKDSLKKLENEINILNKTADSLTKFAKQKQNERQVKTQVWAAENLKVSTFNQEEKIAFAPNRKEWDSLFAKQIPAYCFFDKDTIGNNGYLYNYYAFSSPNLAPKGWRIPNQNDILQLNKNLGKDSVHSANYFKSNELNSWNNVGLDLFNLSIKPFGFRLSDSKEWYSGSKIFFAAQSTNRSKFSVIVLTDFNEDIFILEKDIAVENYGLYVRCIKQ